MANIFLGLLLSKQEILPPTLPPECRTVAILIGIPDFIIFAPR